MCGRFSQTASAETLIKYFSITRETGLFRGLAPRYNIAPTQNIAAIRQEEGEHAACLLCWGLIPYWAKDKKVGYKMINARAETAADKPAFRSAFRSRRCLIPASGFYEWRQTSQGKQPYNIRRRDGEPMAFAGLWEHWHQGGETIESCTIIVTAANEQMIQLHDRMPVILKPADFDLWLDPAVREKDRLMSLLGPYAGELDFYPVSRRVNSPKNDDPGCLERLSG